MRSPLRSLSAQTPVRFVSDRANALSFGRADSRASQLGAMELVGTIFSIVDRCATSTAAPDWKLYRKKSDARVRYTTEDDAPDPRVEVKVHPALLVWNNPNPFMTQQYFIEAGQQYYELAGETWWVAAKNPLGWPQELWPVRPDRMEPVPHPTKFVSGYLYHGPDGEMVPLGVDEVIFTHRPNPRNYYRGISPLASVMIEAQSSYDAARWNMMFFRNSAIPGGVIQVDKTLDDTRFNRLRMQWREQHQGVSAASRVAILEGGMKWLQATTTHKDMDFSALRLLNRDIIREAWGISGFALGDVVDANRANSLAAKTWFAEQMTVPRLERLKQAANGPFLKMFGPAGEGVEFDYCSPVPEDQDADNEERTSKANAAAAMINAGLPLEYVLPAMGLPSPESLGLAGIQLTPKTPVSAPTSTPTGGE